MERKYRPFFIYFLPSLATCGLLQFIICHFACPYPLFYPVIEIYLFMLAAFGLSFVVQTVLFPSEKMLAGYLVSLVIRAVFIAALAIPMFGGRLEDTYSTKAEVLNLMGAYILCMGAYIFTLIKTISITQSNDKGHLR